jgi:alanine racemase
MDYRKYNISMRNLIKRLRKNRYEYDPLIEITINRSHLCNNINVHKKAFPSLKIAPVLKSNAYGHGLIEIASILKDDNDIPFLVVDTYFEAICLRNNNIDKHILIMGYTPVHTINRNHLKNISFMIGDLEILKDLYSSVKQKISIHIKIDTGMHRQGIDASKINEIFDTITTNHNISIEGICSHLSDADNSDEQFSRQQIILWNKIVAQFKDKIPRIKYFHLSNSAGHKYTNEIDANISRLGIALYGLDLANSSLQSELKPVLSMKTVISSIKDIYAGDSVGYSNTFTAQKNMKIAVLPLGYYEGLDRRLSNSGFVTVNGKSCQIIGRISMNISTINISDVDNVNIGDEVLVISDRSSDKNSIDAMAKLAQTIPYEITIHIPAYLKRRIV